MNYCRLAVRWVNVLETHIGAKCLWGAAKKNKYINIESILSFTKGATSTSKKLPLNFLFLLFAFNMRSPFGKLLCIKYLKSACFSMKSFVSLLLSPLQILDFLPDLLHTKLYSCICLGGLLNTGCLFLV